MTGSAPIDRSTTWPYEDGEPGEFSYARFSNPTVVEAERALGELDGGEALLFASGTAASAAVILALLSPGQTVALADGAYYGTGVLLDELERWDVRHVEFDQTGPPPAAADLVWIEAPSNPFLTMPDFEAAVAHSAPVVCDSTAATPLLVRPLERGCQIALHSATKGLAGHDDALVGALVVGDPDTAARLREFRTRTGAIAAPDVAWLLLRGLADTRSACCAPDRERPERSRSISATIQRSRSSAIPGSGHSCRSTSSTPASRRASRPARG